MISYEDISEESIAFAKEAARAFRQDEKLYSYTSSGELELDELIALRWNDERIVVFRISCNQNVINFPMHIGAR